MKRPRWSEDDLRNAVGGARTLVDTVRALGLRVAGGNFQTVVKHITRLGLPTSHWLSPDQLNGARGLRSKVLLTLPDAKVFQNPRTVGSGATVRRTFARACPPERCAICGMAAEWNGRPLVLHMDHIDGNSRNCERSNLRWLCPNCHSQTETYAGRNAGA